MPLKPRSAFEGSLPLSSTSTAAGAPGWRRRPLKRIIAKMVVSHRLDSQFQQPPSPFEWPFVPCSATLYIKSLYCCAYANLGHSPIYSHPLETAILGNRDIERETSPWPVEFNIPGNCRCLLGQYWTDKTVITDQHLRSIMGLIKRIKLPTLRDQTNAIVLYYFSGSSSHSDDIIREHVKAVVGGQKTGTLKSIKKAFPFNCSDLAPFTKLVLLLFLFDRLQEVKWWTLYWNYNGRFLRNTT